MYAAIRMSSLRGELRIVTKQKAVRAGQVPHVHTQFGQSKRNLRFGNGVVQTVAKLCSWSRNTTARTCR